MSRDPIGEAGGMNLYGFVSGNPANAIDPLGLLDAKSAFDYWEDVGINGINRSRGGGAWDSFTGYSQAAEAASISSFIDFFAARTLQENAELSGHYSAIDECELASAGYAALVIGQIGLEAFLATLHAAKNGLHLGKFGYHSLGKGVLKNNLGKEFAKFANSKSFAHFNVAGKHFILKTGKILLQFKYFKTLK